MAVNIPLEPLNTNELNEHPSPCPLPSEGRGVMMVGDARPFNRVQGFNARTSVRGMLPIDTTGFTRRKQFFKRTVLPGGRMPPSTSGKMPDTTLAQLLSMQLLSDCIVFQRLTRSHPSPLIPLPVEGRGNGDRSSSLFLWQSA